MGERRRWAPVRDEQKKRNDEDRKPDGRKRPSDAVGLMRDRVEMQKWIESQQRFGLARHRHEEAVPGHPGLAGAATIGGRAEERAADGDQEARNRCRVAPECLTTGRLLATLRDERA